jgi:hypothetical protein
MDTSSEVFLFLSLLIPFITCSAYGLDDRGTGAPFPITTRYFSLPHKALRGILSVKVKSKDIPVTGS